jgi:hypothetical protein
MLCGVFSHREIPGIKGVKNQVKQGFKFLFASSCDKNYPFQDLKLN